MGMRNEYTRIESLGALRIVEENDPTEIYENWESYSQSCFVWSSEMDVSESLPWKLVLKSLIM